MKVREIIAAAVVLASPTHAFAWGQEGHAAVAEIAQHRLTSSASDVVQRLLRAHLGLTGQQVVSMASIASWADDYRADGHKDTSNWHFVDIPLASLPGGSSATTDYDAIRDCADDATYGSCLLKALPAQEAILSDATKDDESRWKALAFVIHLTGDLAQPLHCVQRVDGSQKDQGGNTLTVTFNVTRPAPDNSTFRDFTTFHSVWDTDLITFKYYDWGLAAAEAEKLLPTLAADLLADDTPEKWLAECHRQAEAAYQALPAGTPLKSDIGHPVILDQAYFEKFHPVVTQQLALGGLHLAAELNEALKGGK
ncbi:MULTISPECIES: S1/P1 nuclease [Mesorhizobium]|nr:MULTISPECIES: S1/P1 nuclease [Mesorhizobium]AAC24514.1 endonuclease S1 homolog [Mesorhizobium loti]MBZ9907555.1 S1/P1 nuclease [Mesorhizobium sp. BR115XR7A]QJF04935.1 S1/P1 nuclease [Mesorhizobium japonicum R7A]QJF11003.1 S1/P1 nuclease [Mesorhizobium japonicum]QJI86877.1 S1/P1 nuclease [Mesorhizobium japonicum]